MVIVKEYFGHSSMLNQQYQNNFQVAMAIFLAVAGGFGTIIIAVKSFTVGASCMQHNINKLSY